MKPEIEKALPAHMSHERMTRIALSAVNSNPELTEVILNNPTSFLGALMQSAQLGLEPNTNLGHAYLIPYYDKNSGKKIVNLQLGYMGLLDLAHRSGMYQKYLLCLFIKMIILNISTVLTKNLITYQHK